MRMLSRRELRRQKAAAAKRRAAKRACAEKLLDREDELRDRAFMVERLWSMKPHNALPWLKQHLYFIAEERREYDRIRAEQMEVVAPMLPDIFSGAQVTDFTIPILKR